MKRVFSILIVFSLIAGMIAGCGGNTDSQGEKDTGRETNASEENENGGGQNDAAEEDSENTAMGRYVETAIDLSEYCIRTDMINKRTDGALVIQDYYNPMLISKDNGETWEQEDTEWFSKLMENDTYIMDMAYGPDGTAVVLYDKNADDGRTGIAAAGNK